MKTIKNITICMVVLLCFVLFAVPEANAATEGIYTYIIEDGEVTITKCETSASGAITIPDTLEGCPVTFIRWYAFQNCTGLTSVTIPDSVTSISNSAFYNCTGLTAVTIPDSVTSIGEFAFYNCTGLTSITIPDSVTSIGRYAFENCTGLTAVTIPNSVTSIGESAFYNCTGLTAVTIPDSVTSIGDDTFYNCKNLTAVTILDSVTSIGSYAFSSCTGLTSITIPDNVTSIGRSAFYKCTSLTSVTIPDNVTSIGDTAFYNCTSLTSVTIPDSVTSIGSLAFSFCTGLTSVTIPDSVTSIGDSAFYNCTGLKDVYITDPNAWCKISFEDSGANPLRYADNGHILDADGNELTEIVLDASVTAIPCYAFSNCKSLTGITIPDDVTAIGESAFYNCTGLTSVTIPDGVTRIEDSAFSSCTGLTSVTIPDSVTAIDFYAFEYCTGLTAVYITDITAWCRISFGYDNANPLHYAKKLYLNGVLVTDLVIPDSVTAIKNYAFQNCNSLASVTIPDSVTSIGNFAFENCTGLTSVIIPDSVTTIGSAAFYKCTGLTSLTIGDSVTTICNHAFNSCSGLTGITIPDSVTSIGGSAFGRCSGLTAVAIPDGVTSIENSAFRYCTGLTAVTIPDSVTTIDWYAFESCFGLKTVYYPGTQAQWDSITIESGNTPLNNAAKLYGHIHDTLSPTGNVAPTCQANGYTIYICVCGKTVTGNFVPALDHSWDNGIYTEPTYTADGFTTYICGVCGETKVETDEGSKLPVAILKQPENITVDSGNDVQFKVEPTGEVVSYKWQYRRIYKWFDTTMPGYNTNTLTVAATGARNGYGYRCIITFQDGTVLYTDPVKLTVRTYMRITSHPNDQTVALGAKGQFTAAAQGEGIKYQWQYQRPGSTLWIDTAMEGATKPTVMIETTTARDGYRYRCKITDITGNVDYTEAATMRVLSFKSHPEEVFSPLGETVTFHVTTSVDSGFTYQWQYSRYGTSWTNVTDPGYNTATLTVQTEELLNECHYRCVLTGSKNSQVVSKTAMLHTGEPLLIFEEPSNVTCKAGETAFFEVVSGFTYSYQWQYQRPGSDSWYITTATGNKTSMLYVTAKAGNNGYRYRCIVTGRDGTVYVTTAATLTVES